MDTAKPLRDALRPVFDAENYPDRYVMHVYETPRALLDAGFARAAARVFAPLIAVRREVKSE